MYKLPDGNEIKMGAEVFKAAEAIFDPTIAGRDLAAGVPRATFQSISKFTKLISYFMYFRLNIILE